MVKTAVDMRKGNRVHISKFLSLVLRHRPGEIGLDVDGAGWAEVDELIEAARANEVPLDRELLRELIRESEKTRFEFSPDGERIRATYGHSIDVDLGLESSNPPEVLYHGTAKRSVESILSEGLDSRGRQFVHLSPTVAAAREVGVRHGSPVVLHIQARELADTGQPFYRSTDQIWLTAGVPPDFIERPAG